ncbi:MAG: hypothetical protein DI587_26280 [Variovorax paradoxus]|nr:MAG: hypothetical protein DI583_26280 [Variovorax paradoxus]PZQ04740.1 MAG: hypothetical protein DI587_26280 [Variovorax paradoxus]
MSMLLRALGLTFSQDVSRRDLQLAHMLSSDAAEFGKAASLVCKDEDLKIEMPTGSFQDLLDQAIAHAAFCESFALASDLEHLGKAVEDDEELARWKSHFGGRRANAGSAPADEAQPELLQSTRGAKRSAKPTH